MIKREQAKILHNEFVKNKNWTKAKVKYLSKILDLPENLIYKWNVDQVKLEKKHILSKTNSCIISKEFLLI